MPTKERSTFGDKLRLELGRQQLSMRKLSKRLNPQNPEVARRNLSRWVAGDNRPSPTNRVAVALALGIDPGELADDDEEDDEDMADLFRVLMQRIEQRVAESVTAALSEEGNADRRSGRSRTGDSGVVSPLPDSGLVRPSSESAEVSA